MLDAAFTALGDPTRRAILMHLSAGEATVQDLAKPFAISQPAISRHLRVMEAAGLIQTRIDGTARPRRLNPAAMQQMWDWLGQYRSLWEARYNRLDDVLAQLDFADTRATDALPSPPPSQE
jgi:DNA-binding transcriptional ArsR family regulator